MTLTLDEQIEQLIQAIAELEARRATLGEAVVETTQAREVDLEQAVRAALERQASLVEFNQSRHGAPGYISALESRLQEFK